MISKERTFENIKSLRRKLTMKITFGSVLGLYPIPIIGKCMIFGKGVTNS